MRKAFLAAGVGVVASCVISACMTRPVVSTEPQTSNLYIEPIRNEVIDKLDLLFVIDNSQSMGDKQALFAKAVPQLVNRLVVPRCVNEAGEVRDRADVSEACPADFEPEFRAVKDIHVAVITSSLGSHGAPKSSCDAPAERNDHGYLLPSVRSDLTSYNNTGFLAWDPEQKLTPPGETNAARFGEEFGKMVRAAGENGCGYEASLESWYRFLIDPEPPLAVVVEDGRSKVTASDPQVLQQREAFLRPDSLVAIVMLTDENDCSIMDEASGYLLAYDQYEKDKKFTMVRANSACARDPNDPCCAPCQVGTLPNCPAVEDDPACKISNYLSDVEDPPNQRCFENKRRFGYDFLYPTQRYIDGLTQPMVVQRSTGKLVENPLFKAAGGKAPRSSSLVYLAGVVGVPWQDIADDASRTGPGLRYLSPSELRERGRWDVIVGDRASNVRPTDPFMVESLAPRSGTNPITGDAIMPETSTNPRANAINGHEQVDSGADLQYACTFQLEKATPCTGNSCDCLESDLPYNRPLCQPPGGGPAETTQYFGKAYPGLRPLEVLKGIGDSAIVASICPKVLTMGQPGYGYEPAVDAIVDRLKVALTGRCLPRPLAVGAEKDGRLPCVVVEASQSASCSCGDHRVLASAEAEKLVRTQMADRRQCDTATTPSCSSFCFCELAQAEGESLEQCLTSEQQGNVPGYCYVDPYGSTPQANPALVEGCDIGKQLIRFVGPNTPTPGATAFIACLGATIQ